MPLVPNSDALRDQSSNEQQCSIQGVAAEPYLTWVYDFRSPPLEVEMPVYLSHQYLNIPLVPPEHRTKATFSTSEAISSSARTVTDESISVSTEVQSLHQQALSERKEIKRVQNCRAQRKFCARKKELIKSTEVQIEVMQGELAKLSDAKEHLTQAVQNMLQRVTELQQQNTALRRLSMSNLSLSEETRRDLISALKDADDGENEGNDLPK